MLRAVRRLKDYYGANPLHLLILLMCLALAGYAAVGAARDSRWPLIGVWFIGALIGHDLILFPLYALIDRFFRTCTDTIRRRRHPTRRTTPALNYIRVPVMGTALTFIVFLPGILQQGSGAYQAATGQTQQPFFARWLLITAAMFGLSAICFAIRAGWRSTRR